ILLLYVVCKCLRYYEIGVQGGQLGTMTLTDSPVESSETLMEHWFGLLLASRHYLDHVLHRWFVDTDRPFSTLSSIIYLLPQFSVSQWLFSSGVRIPFYSSL
ncbi:hypothetical protein HAX54_006137, partial [Datura stramonium]|nr:hypothetical protein [Datura stramonium]